MGADAFSATEKVLDAFAEQPARGEIAGLL